LKNLSAILHDKDVVTKEYIEGYGFAKIRRNTKAEWDKQLSLISDADTIYVYTDYQTITDDQGNTKYIPGIKIGDGLAYVVDLPFIDEKILQHLNNHNIHVTAEEKTFWNNKNRAFVSNEDTENLILTTL
jgi:hypothetical protein